MADKDKKIGWKILFLKLFYDQYSELVQAVKNLRIKKPATYKKHPKTKLLKRVQDVIRKDVPSNPMHKKFMLSNTLKKYKEWRRVKEGLPPRYRLFFRFSSSDKSIIFAWMNDEFTLRKKGDKHDVYTGFESLLEKKIIPSRYRDLFAESRLFC